MMRGELLREAEAQLGKVSPSARLDCELLLAFELEVDRVSLRTHPDVAVSEVAQEAFRRLIERRCLGEPVAYLLGNQEFYARDFEVNRSVLIPRPDTEILIEWALERIAGESQRCTPILVLDMGTGSGCIAVTLAAECPQIEVIGVDISGAALSVAQRNAQRHGVTDRCHFVQGDRLEALAWDAAVSIDLLVSNPPYVSQNDPQLERNVERFEPPLALRDPFEGDGLGFYRYLSGCNLLRPGRDLLMEVGNDQADAVCQLFAEAQWQTEVRRDLSGIERVVRATRPSQE